MNLSGSYKLNALRERVWQALNDPEVLRVCTPGCKQLTLAEDGSFDVELDVGIAAVRGQYTGKIRICDPVPGTEYRLVVNGTGTNGFLNAEGIVRVTDDGGETQLEYIGQAHVGGPIAGVGQRIMEGVAKQIVGQFFKTLQKEVLKG